MTNDRDCLRDLTARYARCVDRRQFHELPEIMAPEMCLSVFMDPNATEPAHRMNGIVEIQQAWQVLHRYESTFHCIGQQLIFDLTADQARGETYCVAHHFHRKNGQAHAFRMYIRYQDRFVRVAGGWKFAERRLIVDRTEGENIDFN
jgi:hypothetical protein